MRMETEAIFLEAFVERILARDADDPASGTGKAAHGAHPGWARLRCTPRPRTRPLDAGFTRTRTMPFE